MISQHCIDTITENLAAEMNLVDYEHLALAEIVEIRLNKLINEVKKYPSRYLIAGIVDARK